MPFQLDKEKAVKRLADVVNKMHTETDLALLNEYRKIFKKEISLFRRSWAAAWLFMYYNQDKNINTAGSSGEKSKTTGKNAKNINTEITLNESESKKLFISIGKNRRLFPRELITFIISKSKVGREDIGSIRVMDTYSFVQIRDEKADDVIKSLNGVVFRGRTLVVNYAKTKES